jgi:hypothetical protein
LHTFELSNNATGRQKEALSGGCNDVSLQITREVHRFAALYRKRGNAAHLKRNPGLPTPEDVFPDFASRHPGYEDPCAKPPHWFTALLQRINSPASAP